MNPRTIAIVGASLAGTRAAEGLRSAGFDGRVVMIGDEPWLPYQRPPLSKEFLARPSHLPADFFLHDQAWYETNTVEMRLGVRATSLELADGLVKLDNGEPLAFDKLLLATGGRPRRLRIEGGDAPNVHYLRTKTDAEALLLDLQPGARLVVIGMGVIGAEVAASARALGCEVTAIEPASAPMLRTLGPRFGAWLGSRHLARGVSIQLGEKPVRLIVGDDKRVRAVETEDGRRIDCDVLVVGVGIEPAVELAAAADLTVADGIVVDRGCRTSHPNVFAAGDVSRQPDFFGGDVRLETFQNASDQGLAAASAMLGHDVDRCRPCWFWSDQYDLNIQVAGRLDYRAQVILRGDVDSDAFTALYVADGKVIGVLTVNRGADMGPGRRLVERRVTVDAAELADPDRPLRDFLRAGAPSSS